MDANVKTLRSIQIFALIFSAIFLLHAPLLRLPYFWDEAGYYIPAAYDFFTTGALVPHSVPSNAHPPLPVIYLACWWKLSAFKPAVTRTAMLLLAALGLTAVFRLARLLTNLEVSLAAVLCTAIYPIWFAQSSLAHSDLPAATFTIWALFFYFRSIVASDFRLAACSPVLLDSQTRQHQGKHSRHDEIAAMLFFALAALCKETAIIFPAALAVYDVAAYVRPARATLSRSLLRPAIVLASAAPLALWLGYHHHATGFFFGNPQYFAYNVSSTLTPLRILLSAIIRLWHMFGYMNLWLLTLATLWSMRYPPLGEGKQGERKRIPLEVQYRILAVIVANFFAYSVLGGAVLARYLLPLYPLLILIGIATLRRRLAEWVWVVALILSGFVLALFSNPFGYIPPEDNLSYRNYVILHKQAADYLQSRDAHARVLTAWTATDELTKPYLGYVRRPMSVVHIEDFSYDQLQLARMGTGEYDVALLFSTKQEPTASLLDRWLWWERISRRYFGFHRDLPPEVAAELLGGRVTWQRRRAQQWIAIVNFDRLENALNQPLWPRKTGFNPSVSARP